MAKNQERMNRAQDRALERLDYVMDCYEAPDFVEVTGSMGGDVITYRIFDDGRMYVKQENDIRKKLGQRMFWLFVYVPPEKIEREEFRL